jgi:hypothetical protein
MPFPRRDIHSWRALATPFAWRVSSNPGLLDPQALRERHLQVKCGTYVSQSEARATMGSPAMPPVEAQKRLRMILFCA